MMLILNDQRGATMVEFALSIGIFLFLLGGIADLGISMHHKSMLLHVSNEISRLIAIRLGNNPNLNTDCSEINVTIENEGNTLANERLGVNVSAWEVTWHSPEATNAPTNPSFNLSLISKLPCFLLCQLSPNGWTARASVESTVARQGLNCCPDKKMTTCRYR